MQTLTDVVIRQLVEPDANPPSTATSWTTHTIEAHGITAEGRGVVEHLWRLRVTVRPDDSVNAAPWSYVINHFIDASCRNARGDLDWCPVTAYSSHDQALACLERQARRLGVGVE